MDTSDPDIVFDRDGICNHCHRHERNLKGRTMSGTSGEAELLKVVNAIREEGQGKDYDCIAGVSGGVDSTYVLYRARQLGLRPLAVHFDNGWNSELAVSNIEKVLKALDIDLYTYVVDWDEFRELQISLLRSSTPDIEVPTDHAIYATLMHTALKHRVRFILNGTNFASESVWVPAWAYGHSDWKYISGLHRRFGRGTTLANIPHFSLRFMCFALGAGRIKFVSPLNYERYDKTMAMQLLEREFGWRPYSGKHHESVITAFLQAYILPRKFGIDKRKAHLSNLLYSVSGGMSREMALAELGRPLLTERQANDQIEFVIKKLKMSRNEFEQIMALPVKSYRDYPSNFRLVKTLKSTQSLLRRIGALHK